MAHSEACQLFIEQQIEEGLQEGKTPYSIGKELSSWVEKLFETKIPANTLRVRADRMKETLCTNVHTNLTYQEHSPSEEKPFIRTLDGRFESGTAPGPGRPAKYEPPQEQPHFRARGTGENEWYTPEKYIILARKVMGDIDLDPASSSHAQRFIKAGKFFTKAENGLDREWFGSVWLNPPYAQPDISLFVSKMVLEISTGRALQAIMLTHNYTDTAWFHQAAGAFNSICFTRGRIAFEAPDGSTASPTQGQAFFYYGPNVEGFREVFSGIGFVR